MSNNAVVTTDPQKMRFGRPVVRGVTVSGIVGMVQQPDRAPIRWGA